MSDTIRTLLIEDQDTDALVLREALAEAGPARFEVTVVHRLSEAFELLDRQAVDVVLLDLSLPDSHGLDTYRLLQERVPDVPIVIVTIIEDEALAVSAVHQGAQDYIVKRQIEPPFVRRAVRYAIERKRIRRQLAEAATRERSLRLVAEAANRARDEFFMTLSHELRTPLNAIIGWSALVQGGTLPDDERARALSVIDRNANSLGQLLDDLLEMSRIMAGKIHIEARPVDLRQVVQETLEAVHLAADNRRIRLVTDLAGAGVTMNGDPDRLKQVLWNLLTNAIKFTPEDGEVRITLSGHGRSAHIAVADTGIGISEDLLPHVFERFRQGSQATNREYQGLGLGLSLVKHLVELHGGRVSASSPGLGQGATFVVELPLAAQLIDADRLATPAETIPAGALNGVTVLVVDDEPMERDLMERLLRLLGARVATAGSAAEALARVNSDLPDLLLADIGMPVDDGYALIRSIRSSPFPPVARLPAVAITAYAGEEVRSRAIEAGFQQHMAKPLKVHELSDALLDVLQQA